MIGKAHRVAGADTPNVEGRAMTAVMVIWLIVLSVLLYLVYRRAEEGRALEWRVEELRRELESAKRSIDETRKKQERASFPV